MGQIILITILLNLAASIGDFLVALRLRRWSAQSLVVEDTDVYGYMPLSSKPAGPFNPNHRSVSQ